MDRHVSKFEKYSKDIKENLMEGWKLKIVCGEVGAKGWIPPNMIRDLNHVMGFKKSKRRDLANHCSYVARQCSLVIWLNRNNKDFKPVRVSHPDLAKDVQKPEKSVKKLLKPSKLHLLLLKKRGPVAKKKGKKKQSVSVYEERSSEKLFTITE